MEFDKRNYYPCMLLPNDYSCLHIIAQNALNKQRCDALSNAYDLVSEEYRLYLLRQKSNNWLRLHGYPMRRGSTNYRTRYFRKHKLIRIEEWL